jgi:hypothetical protein
MSPDPAGLAAVSGGNPQSWNANTYVMNSPLNGGDPLGLTGPCGSDANYCRKATWYTWIDGQDIKVRWVDSFKQVYIPPTGYNYINGEGDFTYHQTIGGFKTIGTNYGFGYIATLSGMSAPDNWDKIVRDAKMPQIRPNPGGKERFCSDQADKAAIEELFPGILRGDYTSSSQKKALIDPGLHVAVEVAELGGFAHWLKAATGGIGKGVPVSLTETALGVVNGGLIVLTGYNVMDAAGQEYKACMNYLNGD